MKNVSWRINLSAPSDYPQLYPRPGKRSIAWRLVDRSGGHAGERGGARLFKHPMPYYCQDRRQYLNREEERAE